MNLGRGGGSALKGARGSVNTVMSTALLSPLTKSPDALRSCRVLKILGGSWVVISGVIMSPNIGDNYS